MLGSGAGPLGFKGMNVSINVSADTNAILIKGVSGDSRCIGLKGVSAGCGMPVSALVACPGSIVYLGVSAGNVCTNVADTVVVLIIVSAAVSISDGVRAGGLVPMLGLAGLPFIGICMSVIVIPLTSLNVADTVVICINVNALNVSLALITLKVGVSINVVYALKLFAALVALKVFISILVVYALKLGLAVVTAEILVCIYVVDAIDECFALVTFKVAVSIYVVVAIKLVAADITVEVHVLNIAVLIGAGNVLAAKVAFAISGISVYVILARKVLTAKVTVKVAVLVNVLFTFKLLAALVALEVYVIVNVLGAGKLGATSVTLKVAVSVGM